MTEQVARDPVEELAEEFLARFRRGERPSVGEYTTAHPELADEIRDLFPALVMMEEAKPAGTEPRAVAAGPEVPPDRLGDYRILREVARGGMGVVYEAEQVSLGRHVALKVLPAQAGGDPIRLLRFRREARSAAKLHHTNIVPVFDVGSADGVHYYAMQFIQGQGLDEVLQELRRLRAGEKPTDAPAADLTASLVDGLRTGQFPACPVPTPALSPSAATRSESLALLSEPARHYFRSVARLGVQAADALAYAHAQRVLHRDIKPSNLLLDRQGTLWLTDFGLAKDEGDDLTRTGDIIGTLRYMAPERYDGVSEPRTDVYALGITLYEMVTLKPAFADADRARLMQRVAKDDPVRPRAVDPSIPRDLETIVLKAIEKEPARRYPTAGDLAEDLRRFLTDRPILARRASWGEQAWRWCRRNRGPAAAATAAFLLLVGGVTGTTVGLVRAERARQAEADQRRAAEAERDAREAARKEAVANLLKAHEAANRFLTRFAQEDLFDVPQMEPVRRRLLQDALEFYQGFLQQQGDDPLVRREAALAYGRYGAICCLLGRGTEAEQALRRAIVMLEAQSAEGPLGPGSRSALVEFYTTLGGLLGNRPAEQEQTLREALRLAEGLAKEFPDAPQYRRLRSVRSLNLVTPIFYTRPGEARELCRRVIAAEERNGDPHLVAGAWVAWGRLQWQDRNTVDAEKAYRRALSIYEKSAGEFPAVRGYQVALADALANLGEVLTYTRNFPEAEQSYRRATNLAQKLADGSPDVPGYRENLAKRHQGLASVLTATRRYREAETCLREAVTLYDKLAADYRAGVVERPVFSPAHFGPGQPLMAGGGTWDVAHQRSEGVNALPFRPEFGLMISQAKLMAVLAADGRPAEAETTLRDLMARLKALEAEFAGQPQHRYDLACAQASAARALMEIDRHRDAEKPCRRALALFAELLDQSPADAEYIERVAGEHFRLAKILSALDRPEDAGQSYGRAAPLYGKLAAAEGPRKEAFQLAQASSQNNVAWVLVTRTDPKSRKPAEAVKAAREATDLVPKAGDFWNTRGLAHYRAGDWKGAIAALEKSMELRKGGDSFDWFFVAMARWQLGEKEKAREWSAKAVQWMEKHRPKEAELLRFRAEADELIKPDPDGTPK